MCACLIICLKLANVIAYEPVVGISRKLQFIYLIWSVHVCGQRWTDEILRSEGQGNGETKCTFLAEASWLTVCRGRRSS